MTLLINRLAGAIFRQEGNPADSTNPGNLRFAPWYPNPRIVNGFWEPPSIQAGTAGAMHVIALRIAEGQSLRQLISAWAPPSDGNDTESYIAHVKEWADIPDENVPLWNYIV